MPAISRIAGLNFGTGALWLRFFQAGKGLNHVHFNLHKIADVEREDEMIGFLRIVVLGVFFTLWFCMDYSQALDTEFHGRIQSTFVLRDNNGFQYDVFDQAKGMQWRNELKFEVTAKPEYELEPALRLDKIFLSYRGAYDAIFDVLKDRDAWQDPAGAEAINEKSTADFDLGRDDIEYENDLREAFIDIVGETEFQSVTLRLGRQIVQWGEADGFNLVNVLNPNDNSVLMFFETPEELATPLWMGRINYSKANLGALHNIGVEVALIPDIRPQQFAPLHDTQYEDYNCNAPYAFGFKQLKARDIEIPFPQRDVHIVSRSQDGPSTTSQI